MNRLALLAYVLVTFLSFPHPVAGGVLDLGLWISWLGPACLVFGLRGMAPGRAARTGFVVGTIAHSLILHWIYIVTVVYGHAPVIAGIVGPLGLGAYMALFIAAFAGIWAWLVRRGLGTPWAAALLWTVLDHSRSFFLSGFPWATLGYAQHENLALLPWVSFTGVYGLSFFTVLGGVALLQLRQAPRMAIGCLVFVVLAHAAGWFGLREADSDPTDSVRVAVIQGNIDQGVKWSPEHAERTLQIYERLSRQAGTEGADIIVWPETAVPGALNRSLVLNERIANLARETGAALVVGSVAVEPASEDPGTRFHYYDSAFVYERDGRLSSRYDKAKLVPFGEYVPLRDLLGGFLAAVARGMAPDNVTRGAGPSSQRIESVRLGDVAVTAGIPICYELIFPDLVRRFVDDGAGALLAVTNDAWYGRTGAPYQFLAMTAVRSAENRVWTARAANTGVSAIIDSRGRVLRETAIFEEAYLVADVSWRPPPLGGSFYTHHGDRFAHAAWFGVLALCVAAAFRGSESLES